MEKASMEMYGDSQVWANDTDKEYAIKHANDAAQAYIDAIEPYTEDIKRNRQNDLN
jgi:hypothetical protein